MIPREIKERLAASSTSEDGIMLATLSNDDWPDPRRYASHGPEMQIVDGQPRFGVTSDGEWYEHAALQPVFTDDRDGDLPAMEFALQNIATDVSDLADEEIENVSVDLVVVAFSDTDQLLGQVRNMNLINVESQDEATAIDLGYRTIANEPSPAWRMNKVNVPGIFY